MSRLRVMTFNIHGTYNWGQRIPLNVGVIQHMSPDIIGFQEAQRDNQAVYEEQLPDYDYSEGPEIEGKALSYNPIFWKPSHIKPVTYYGYWLSETPDTPSLGWDAADMRAMCFHQYKLLDNGQEFVHVNTHLDHRVERARIESAKLIIRTLADFEYDALPVILTGDFNCNPDSTVYQFLQEHGFVDVYRATGHKDSDYPETGNVADSTYSNTVHAYGWTKPSSSGAKRTGSMRFDWILLRDDKGRIRSTSCEIVREAQPPLYPSDHYPVVADFELP